jgi:putative CocE/NonD family hydrolase
MMPTEDAIDCGAGVRLIRGRTMRTRDGIQLVSDHYLPPGGAPAPTLMMRQPYGRDIASTVVYAHPVWFASHGYHVVIQDVRGRGDSEGDFYPFRYEAEDGFDAIQWAASLPESNGKVGMYGFSYQGLTQLLAATQHPPALVAIAPAMTAADLYHGWFYHGGLFRLASGIGWGTQMLRGDAIHAGLSSQSEKLERAWSSLVSSYTQAPYSSLAHLTAEGLPSYYRDWIEHDKPSEYWSQQDISSRYGSIEIPALHISGWYDTYLQGSLDGFTALREQAGTEEARANQFLIAGPWQHIPWDRKIGEQDLGPEAVLDTDTILLRWFNHWLKKDGSFGSEPRVRVFSLGENKWRNISEWPPAPNESKDISLFLGSAGKANSANGDGRLDRLKSETSQKRDTLVVDPEVPVMASGGITASPGPFRQDRLEAGNNILIYRSEPLERPIHVCGNPQLKVVISSSSPACDVVVKLTRIDKQMQTWNICLGAARSSALFPDELPPADVPTTWSIRLDGTSCVFDQGERIGLEIAGTAFPLLDRSSNRVDIPARNAGPQNWKRVTLQILHDDHFASELILPTLV